MKKYILGISLIAFLLLGYFIVNRILSNSIQPKIINKNGFKATYFAQNSTEKKAAIVLIGGGQWGDYWAQQFANKGFVGLSLKYLRQEGLPTLPEEIDLEYFEKAITWLKKQAKVDPKKIVVMGASRNAELSLLIASTFPELVSGAVAYAPSSVVWSNTVLPYNSDELKPSWKYQGKDVPYIAMDKILGNDSDKIETLDYWKNGLAKTEAIAQAAIRVEKINGPILLFSGMDDQVWPSAQMADMIEQRLKESNFKFALENVKYENSGHLISTHPEMDSKIQTGSMKINGKYYEYKNGGTNEGDRKAKQDAKTRLMAFIKRL